MGESPVKAVVKRILGNMEKRFGTGRWSALWMLIIAGVGWGQPVVAQSTFTIGGKGVYGLYRNSLVQQFLSGRLDMFYRAPSGKWEIALGWRRSDFRFEQEVIAPLNFNHIRWNLIRRFSTPGGGTLILQGEAGTVISTEENVDGRIPLYGSLGYLSPSQKYYLDASVHYFPTGAANKLELWATTGMALFNYYLWAQVAGHVSLYSREVQGLKRGWSLHPEITYYAIPRKLTLTAYGIFGEQVFAYNPGTLVLYTSNIVLTTSAGLTIYYRIDDHITPYADVQYEAYENREFQTQFSATYFTVGMFWGL